MHVVRHDGLRTTTAIGNKRSATFTLRRSSQAFVARYRTNALRIECT